jgi:hypothetical protein
VIFKVLPSRRRLVGGPGFEEMRVAYTKPTPTSRKLFKSKTAGVFPMWFF